MNAIVACLLLLAAGCFAAPVENEISLPISDQELANLNEAIKHLAGDEYSLDAFSKPVQLFFWKVHMMSVIEYTYVELRNQLGLLKEDSDSVNSLQKFYQQVLLAIVELPRKEQAELEDAAPGFVLNVKDASDFKWILGEKLVVKICSAKPENDADEGEGGLDDDIEQPSNFEEE